MHIFYLLLFYIFLKKIVLHSYYLQQSIRFRMSPGQISGNLHYTYSEHLMKFIAVAHMFKKFFFFIQDCFLARLNSRYNTQIHKKNEAKYKLK